MPVRSGSRGQADASHRDGGMTGSADGLHHRLAVVPPSGGRRRWPSASACSCVVAAFVVPHLHLGIVTPLINATPERFQNLRRRRTDLRMVERPRRMGHRARRHHRRSRRWCGDRRGARLSVARACHGLTWATSCAWAFSLAMIDGWQRGFAGRLTARHEYLRQVPTSTTSPRRCARFARRIPDFQPDSWITHVSGHPPGALLTFVWLDRIGLGGGAWAGLLCLLVGSSAAAAIVVAVRAWPTRTPRDWRRRSSRSRRPRSGSRCPPTATTPAWPRGVSRCWRLAVRRHGAMAAAGSTGSGLLLGWGIFCNYGLALMALPALAVLLIGRDWRAALRALVPAALVALAVVVGVSPPRGSGGSTATRLCRNAIGRASRNDRPFQYWSWANFASVVCAIGLGSVAGIGRAFDIAAIRAPSRPASRGPRRAVAILFADLSHAEQGRNRTHLAAVHGVAHRGCALLPPASHTAGGSPQRHRRAAAQQLHPDELVTIMIIDADHS